MPQLTPCRTGGCSQRWVLRASHPWTVQLRCRQGPRCPNSTKWPLASPHWCCPSPWMETPHFMEFVGLNICCTLPKRERVVCNWMWASLALILVTPQSPIPNTPFSKAQSGGPGTPGEIWLWGRRSLEHLGFANPISLQWLHHSESPPQPPVSENSGSTTCGSFSLHNRGQCGFPAHGMWRCSCTMGHNAAGHVGGNMQHPWGDAGMGAGHAVGHTQPCSTPHRLHPHMSGTKLAALWRGGGPTRPCWAAAPLQWARQVAHTWP